MITPPYLKKGDKIAIISTARKIVHKEIETAITILKYWGLQPIIGKTIGIEDHQFAGSDEQRTADLQRMIDDRGIKAIWCARGGYGTVRIIDQIDFTSFITHPKWIIGYSDITVLHSHIHNMGIASLHAVMPIDIGKSSREARESLKRSLFGDEITYAFLSSKKNKSGSCTGKLIGGNLSILYSLCGSPSSIHTDGKILCIEDLDEYLYHIDRMFQNLKRNGYFTNLSGLIVGGMTKMHDNAIPFGKKAKKIILDTVKEYDFPVVFNFPMGHIEDNRALILGAEVSLSVSKEKVDFSYVGNI